MIRWYPMARATSRLAGNPIVFDLTKIRFLTLVQPDYQPIVRDLETVRRGLRRKQFGVRPSAQVGFQVPHSRVLNSLARYRDIDGKNLLLSPFDMSGSHWTPSNLTVAQSSARGPRGTLTAWNLDDASGLVGSLTQVTLFTAIGSMALLTLSARADVPHIFSLKLTGTSSSESDFNSENGWRRYSLARDFGDEVGAIQVTIRATQNDGAQTGDIDIELPDLRRVVSIPGTDEEILADLKDKWSSDDWDVELTLDGGLTWRFVLLDDHQKLSLEEKWTGYSERFSLVASRVVQRVPATLDGVW